MFFFVSGFNLVFFWTLILFSLFDMKFALYLEIIFPFLLWNLILKIVFLMVNSRIWLTNVEHSREKEIKTMCLELVKEKKILPNSYIHSLLSLISFCTCARYLSCLSIKNLMMFFQWKKITLSETTKKNFFQREWDFFIT